MVDNLAGRLRNILKKSETTSEITTQVVVADTTPVEPESLALRIQALIDDLPTPTATTIVKNQKPPQRDKDGRPIPPPAHIKDSKLLRLLNSATIMNGSRDRDSGRPSIWGILEHLGAPKREDDAPPDSPPPNSRREGDDGIPDIFSDAASVMVYSPLLPTRDSLVELADSEVVVEEEEVDEPEPAPAPAPAPPIPGWSWSNALPSSVTSWLSQQPPPPPSLVDANGQPFTPRTHERHLRALATRVWIPSKDKLSIQCMWWGYRMFLPPPVLDILNDKQLEAAKRAAMITTALTWFFNNLPISSLPLTLRPILLLLQRIAPFLGYIGTFISWSWSTIKSYDQGYGVILSATWLLPIALIPGTWLERDWPISPPPVDHVPLPPEPSSSPQPPPETVLAPTPAPTLIPQPGGLSTPTPSIPPLPEIPPMSPPPPEPTLTIPIASPVLTFVTAPSSPVPSSPKRIQTSLANLVAKSPKIRIPLSKTRLKNVSSPPTSIEAQLSQAPSMQQEAAAYPSPVHTSPASPVLTAATASISTSTSIAASSTSQPSISDLTHMQPSPPANPNDLRLLQSPIWQNSPLPPEHGRHPALPLEMDEVAATADLPKEKKRRKGMGIFKGRQ